MATSKEYLKDMLYSGKEKGYSHMVVVCDSWDYTDFIVYIKDGESLEERLKEYRGLNTLYRIVEIYNYGIDLNYQLNEYRAFHEEVEDITSKKVEKKLERLEKLPGFVDEYSLGKVRINSLGVIPFEQMKSLPYDTNGYIDQEGNFYPAVKITSNRGNNQAISMGQFAECFIYMCVKNPLIISEYEQLISSLEKKNAWDIFRASDEFIINRLGFAKFYRYINDYEYGTTSECSCIPDNYSAEQLIMLQQLFIVNHNGSTNIIEKGIQYSLKLSQKAKGQYL